jgi:hypothetical protein
MKKFSFCALLMFALLNAANAQTAPAGKKLNWGFKVGLNGSNIRVEDGLNSDWKTGLATGVFFTIKAGNKFTIQPEFLYSSMGGKNLGSAEETSLRLNYFSLPLLAKYQVTNKLSVVAGPQVDVVINAKSKSNAGFDEVTNNYRENSFNATGGIEVWPAKCLGFSARYIYGLNNIAETGVAKLKNQGVQVMLAVKL